MSFKKTLKYKMLEKGLQTGFQGGLGKWVKRIAITAVVCGIVVVILGVALISYTVSKFNSLAAAKPDTDLMALQQLLQEKTIVLTQEQKANITPLLKELVVQENNPEQTKALKDKVWDILAPEQVKAAAEWKTSMEKQAGSLVESSKAPLAEAISNATGIPAETLKKPLDSLTAWWNLTAKQATEADQLLKQVESK
jgi:hypothetical protein